MIPETDARRSTSGTRRRFDWLGIGVPALIAYIPLLLTHRGMVGADTKTYLYLDPGRLLSEAPYIWNTDVGLGSVTHQNIGYLWPMGPFYLLFETLGVPDWVAQRLWLGTVLFAAAMGVRFLLRTIGWGSIPSAEAACWWPPSPTCSAPTCSPTRRASRSSCCPGRRCRG